MAKQLLEALAQVINLKEGMAEISAGETLEAVLPPKIAKLLDVPDSVTFSTAAAERKCQLIGYNSEIFQRCETLLGEEGSLASFAVQYQGYLKQSGFDKLVTETLCPQNGLLRVGQAMPAWTPYCLFNIAYTAEADEKRLGLVSTWLNGVTGVAGVEIGDALLWKGDRIDVPSDGQLKADWLWEVAQQVAHSQIEKEIAIWLLSTRHRKKGSEIEEDIFCRVAWETGRCREGSQVFGLK
jgi:hypothetical protein